MATERLLQAGIAAVKAGDLNRARSLLAKVVQADPTSEQGWWWLSFCTSAPDQREYCLRRVLAINPNHAEARRQLQDIARLSTSAKPTTPGKTPAPEAKVSSSLPARRAAPPAQPATPPTPTPAPGPKPAPSVAPVPPAPRAPGAQARAPRVQSSRTRIVAVVVVLGLCLVGVPLLYALASGQLNQVATLLGWRGTPPPPTPTPIRPPTLPPPWTLTPSRVPPTPTPTRTPDPTVDYRRRFEAAQADIAQATALMQAGQPAEAVPFWDRVIAAVPEYAEAHYQRAQSYVQLAASRKSRSEYQDDLQRALADLNEAIFLGPTPGDYYLARYRVYTALAGIELYRVDQDEWYILALDDTRIANVVGNSDEFSASYPAVLLFRLGRCQEGLEEINRLIAASQAPRADLNIGLSDGELCQGQFDPALKSIDEALKLEATFAGQYRRAILLYNLGRLDDALAQINQTLDESPDACGCRYYLRALINYEQGKPDLARADIELGSEQTWEPGGLRSYVLGRLALDAGDRAQGAELLREAEASLRREYGPRLLQRIQDELRALGAAPLAPTPHAPSAPTPSP